MQNNQTPTAIAQVESHRPSLLVFEIRAKITKEDMEWMARRVDAAFDVQEKVDLLLIMTNFDGAELGAVFDGEAAGVMVRSLKHVRRYGVVGAPGWARGMIELFKWTTPVEEKTFALEELAEARRWIDAPDGGRLIPVDCSFLRRWFRSTTLALASVIEDIP